VILIQGVNSGLDTTAASTGLEFTFHGPGSLVAYLQSNGWDTVPFLEYSYLGGAMQGDRWAPRPYSCEDTFTQSIRQAVDRLADQIDAYLAVHPATDLYLVGHSQGGLIAFAYLVALVTQDHTLAPPGRVAGVVTLDAPLGGLPLDQPAYRNLFEGVMTVLCSAMRGKEFQNLSALSAIWNRRPTDADTFAGSSQSIAAGVFGFSQQDGSTVTNQAVARDGVARSGTWVLTAGNVNDLLYSNCEPSWHFGSTQWLADGGAGSGVFARAAASGAACSLLPGPIHAAHAFLLADPNAQQTVLTFLEGTDPAPLGRAEDIAPCNHTC
jgi:pimeloyl-ACP methyl ester carboxylesterase